MMTQTQNTENSRPPTLLALTIDRPTKPGDQRAQKQKTHRGRRTPMACAVLLPNPKPLPLLFLSPPRPPPLSFQIANPTLPSKTKQSPRFHRDGATGQRGRADGRTVDVLSQRVRVDAQTLS